MHLHLQFRRISPLVRNDDSLQCRVKADIPCKEVIFQIIAHFVLNEHEAAPHLQNWVTAPSPPEATGMKDGFALQLAPHDQFAVWDGLQYAVLA